MSVRSITAAAAAFDAGLRRGLHLQRRTSARGPDRDQPAREPAQILSVVERSSEALPSAQASALPLLVQAIACSILIAIPFLAVHFPPITDLPQQTAQIRLLQEAWQDPAGPYRIQWLTPYGLQYLVLAAAWALAGPAAAGRVAMLVVGLLWVAAAHLIAWRLRRPPAAAALASILFFTHATYWGLYGFALGWPAFALWIALTTGPRRDRLGWREGLATLGVGWLLYMTHVLWLGVAVLWLAVSSAVRREPRQTILVRGLALAPALVSAAVWYPQLAAGGFKSATLWGTSPLARLSPSWLVTATLGGLRGMAEAGIVAVLALWMLLAWVQRRRTAASPGADRGLLIGAGLFAGLALLLPELYANTNQFGSRWMPIAVALLLLGCPALRWKRAITMAAALALLATLCLGTAGAWRRFERVELSGLPESLAALPERPRVIGLDYAHRSDIVRGRPFLQAFAYAQVLRGGRLSFSFAEFAPSLVVFRARDEVRWTRGTEWFPDRLRPSDLLYFDHALVNADEAGHSRFAALPAVRAVTTRGRWRLYRIDRPGS